ncbi:hypothetical protein BH20ACT19_BH20ACT19_11830 [soil metagenome]
MAAERFSIIERSYSDDEDGLSVGIANIHATVPDVEANKDTIVRVAQAFAERGVDYAVFPEFCLSGYFWDDAERCREYMDSAVTEEHLGWIESELEPLLGKGGLEGIVLNNLRHAGAGRYYNSSFVVDGGRDYLADESTYDKVFLPGIEREHTTSGRDDRLVLETRHGRFGFTSCYDYLFGALMREYAMVDECDAIIQLASWRAEADREYAGLNVRTPHYYAELWDTVIPAVSATNQVWTFACNAVGEHGITGARFCGGSGVWAPSGLCLLQASRTHEELLIVHNLDVAGARDAEQDDFDYAVDFKEIYRPLGESRGFSRQAG